MIIRKVIERRFRHQGQGINAVGHVSAAVAANIGTESSRSYVSTESRQRIVQRSGPTQTNDHGETTREGSQDDANGGASDRD